MAVIMIDGIMAVPVQSTEKVFLELVGMPMLGNDLRMLLRVGDPLDMRDQRHD